MYQHYLTTTDGRTLHLNLDTGVVKDQDGRRANGNTEGYISGGSYQRLMVGTPNELRHQPLNRLPIE